MNAEKYVDSLVSNLFQDFMTNQENKYIANGIW